MRVFGVSLGLVTVALGGLAARQSVVPVTAKMRWREYNITATGKATMVSEQAGTYMRAADGTVAIRMHYVQHNGWQDRAGRSASHGFVLGCSGRIGYIRVLLPALAACGLALLAPRPAPALPARQGVARWNFATLPLDLGLLCFQR